MTMLIKFHANPKPLNESLGVEMGNLAKYSVISYALGVNYFYLSLGGTTLFPMINVIMMSLFILVPFTNILYRSQVADIIHGKFKHLIQEIEFWKYRLYLHTDFERANPITRHDAIETVKRDREELKCNPQVRLQRIWKDFDVTNVRIIESINEYLYKKSNVISSYKFRRGFYDYFMRKESEQDDNYIVTTGKCSWISEHFMDIVVRKVNEQRARRFDVLSTSMALHFMKENPDMLFEDD